MNVWIKMPFYSFFYSYTEFYSYLFSGIVFDFILVLFKNKNKIQYNNIIGDENCHLIIFVIYILIFVFILILIICF